MSVILGVDVGSYKVTSLIGEPLPGGAVRVRGVGHAPSEGIRKGEVVNVEEAAGAIASSIERAERMAEDIFDTALAGIGGVHLTCVNNVAGVPCGRRPKQVLAADVDRVLETAGTVPTADGREILHVLPRWYRIDGGNRLDSPIGMEGYRLEADVHIVSASSAALNTVRRCLDMADVGQNRLVVSTLAAAEAALTRDERELGVMVVDCGHSLTGIACFRGGALVYTGTLPVGGRNMTSDLATVLQTPLEQAERIKQTHGHVLPEYDDDETSIKVVPFGAETPREVTRKHVSEVLAARADEMATMVLDALREAQLEDDLPAGVVLVGGGAELNGLPKRLSERWGLPVRVGSATQIAGLTDTAGTPGHAAAVGLLMWAARGVRDAAIEPGRNGSSEPGGGIRGVLASLKRAFLPRRGP